MSKRIEGGLVVMFDGPDGVGKSTHVQLAAESLEADGFRVYTTRVNGGTPIGEALRKVILSDLPRTPKTDLFIMRAAYAEAAEDLRKKLKEGVVCLVDRSPLTIIAYQAFGSGLEKSLAYQAADETFADFTPDLVLTYHAPQAVFAKRRSKRNGAQGKTDHFESKPPEYLARVAAGYQEAAEHYHAQIIDASGDIPTIQAKTMELIRSVIKAKTGR